MQAGYIRTMECIFEKNNIVLMIYKCLWEDVVLVTLENMICVVQAGTRAI